MASLSPVASTASPAAAAVFPAAVVRARAIMLTTFRASGEGVETPVWTVGDQGRLYVRTAAASGKVRRIRRDARVDVAPCTQRGRVTGAAVPGSARLLAGEEARAIAPAFHRRYPVLARLFEIINRMQGETQVYLEILPT